MLALGLPVSATSAVMLAAFQTYGIQPGPLLFDREPELVWGLIASLFIGNALLLVLNLPLAPFWAKLLSIPRPYLYAGILFFASLGAFAVNAQPFDLVVLLVLGALGFAMRRFGLPVLPAIIGVILGPRAELQLRRALQISGGEISGLFTSGVAIAIYTLIALILLWPLINRFVVRRFRKPAHEVHHGHAHALVELAEELAADSEHLFEDESVLDRAERETGPTTTTATAPAGAECRRRPRHAHLQPARHRATRRRELTRRRPVRPHLSTTPERQEHDRHRGHRHRPPQPPRPPPTAAHRTAVRHQGPRRQHGLRRADHRHAARRLGADVSRSSTPRVTPPAPTAGTGTATGCGGRSSPATSTP